MATGNTTFFLHQQGTNQINAFYIPVFAVVIGTMNKLFSSV